MNLHPTPKSTGKSDLEMPVSPSPLPSGGPSGKRPGTPDSGGSRGEQSALDDARECGLPPLRGLRFWLGTLALGLATAVSGMLVADALGGIGLPGCGLDSPCAKAAGSVWGKIPGVDWPVSFLGFAYFLAALVSWIHAPFGITVPGRIVVRIGAAASVGFVVALTVEGHLCVYCALAHLGNLAFWWTTERAPRLGAAPWRPVVAAALVFGGVSGSLAFAKGAAERQQEAELSESTAQILSKAGRRDVPQASSGAAGGDAARNAGFTGRYRWGPEASPIRIVLFTDYQCPGCRLYELQVAKIRKEHPEVSISVKQHPMCADCNPHFIEHNMHPNACWAARASEAAGLLRGNDGFWELHHWLFEQSGEFDNTQLENKVRELGYDAQEFFQVMKSDATLLRVQSDIEEAQSLGIHRTPMVFVNGVELKGIGVPNALVRTVDLVAARNLPARTAVDDRPPPAAEKYLADWRDQPRESIPPGRNFWTRSGVAGAVRVDIWGDYMVPFTAMADAMVRAFAESRSDVTYSFRHYPMDQECNPSTPTTKPQYRGGCRAALAVEAAAMIGGEEGFRGMHEWMLANQSSFTEELLRDVATALHLDPELLFETMDGPEVRARIVADAREGKELRLERIPWIFVDGRLVPRFRREGDDVLGRILLEALEKD